ncbi:MAG: FecR protein [Gemmatimonadetes bacterium]|nr:FecR protein [Gemmatimonadota bacterium]
MIDDPRWSQLSRYFARECTPAEALAIEAWLAEDDNRAREAARLREIWAMSAIPERPARTDDAWQRLSARMHVSERMPPVALHQTAEHVAKPHFRWRQSESRSRRVALAAASLVLFAVGAVTAVATQRRQLSQFWRTEIREPVAEQDREFRTARGQRAVVVLGDGSRVELGAESFMRVRPFNTGPRRIVLSGQAVFDVVHDSLRPFTVHAANAITEDLGTRFSVRAYPGDKQVQVLVTSGKVALRAVGAPATSGTVLGPADLGVLDSTGRSTVKNGVDSGRFLAWTQDRLVFDDAPLDDVLPEIGRWFDVTIQLENPRVGRRRITLNVPARSLSAVLGAATVPLGLHFTTTDRVVVIR